MLEDAFLLSTLEFLRVTNISFLPTISLHPVKRKGVENYMQMITKTKMFWPFVKFCKELSEPWLWIVIIIWKKQTNKNENNHFWTVDERNEWRCDPHSI